MNVTLKYEDIRNKTNNQKTMYKMVTSMYQ